jgi:serine/threonine protein kinase
LSGKSYNESADIFSAGIILFIMLSGYPPFQYATKQDWWFNKIITGRHSLFWKAHERSAYFSDSAKDLLNKILTNEPATRITLEQIEEHEWFKGATLSAEELKEELGSRKREIDNLKAQRKVEKKPTKFVESLGDSYIVNRSILGPDGLPLKDPLLAANEQGGDMKENYEPEIFGEDSAMGAYTVFETQLQAPAILAVFNELLGAINCTVKFDASEKCTIHTKFTPKGGLMQIPKDLLEDENDPFQALTATEEPVGFSIKIFQSNSNADARIVVVRRTEGSALTFQQLYDELTQTLAVWGYVKTN